MKLDHHDQMWTLIGEMLWDILVLLDEKALLELGTCTRYLLIQCERRRLQVFLHQVKSPEKRSAGKLRLSDDGHVSRKLCPPPKRLLRVQNTRSVQGALMKLSRVVKDEDQLVISSILPWVECGDQSTRACALRAVGRVCRFGHSKAVSALMRCIRESSLNAAAMLELGNTLQRLVPSNDPDILKEIYQLLESNAFPVRHAALQALPHVCAKGDEKALEKILARVDDKDVEIREEAIRALGKVANADDHGALNCIIRGLRDESIYVRQAALEVMP